MLTLLDESWAFLAGVIFMVSLSLIVMILMAGAREIVRRVVRMFTND